LLEITFFNCFFLLFSKEYFEQQKLKAAENPSIAGIKKMTKKDVMDYRIQALLEGTFDEVKKSRNKYLTEEGHVLQQSDPKANPQQIQEHLQEEVVASDGKEKKKLKGTIKYFSLKKARDLESAVRDNVMFKLSLN
jgi:hypothetical protein